MSFALVFLLVLDGERPRHPWIIRSVLDDRPRMVTLALHRDLWVAYDATHCGLFKAWKGDVAFEGAVYDSNHGPSPRTRGTPLLTAAADPTWTVLLGDKPLDAQVRFDGYSVKADVATLKYTIVLPDQRRIVIQETPDIAGAGSGAPSLKRRLAVGAIPEGVMLRAALGSGDASIVQASLEGVGRLTTTPHDKLATFQVLIDRPGSLAVTFDWRLPAQP